ncbi:MAG: hypothetical protein NTY86_19655 [Deltaproteobacteria bacterium]|nr:hypothetical protein [Deltaproteobacteria bacterium]
MGFLNNLGQAMGGIGQGLNQGADNFAKIFMARKQQQQEDARLKATTDYQNVHLKLLQDAAQREETQGLRERMAVQPMPEYPTGPGIMGAVEAYPEEPKPMTDADMIRGAFKANPSKFAAPMATLATKENAINPVVAKLIEAAQNGTINDQGKAVLKMAGYDMFSPKPGPLTTGIGPDGKPTRVVDAPGVTPYEKPATPNLSNSHEDKYDETTGITFRRLFNYDPVNGTRSGHSDWAPIKQEKQPVDPSTKLDYEAGRTLLRTLPKLKEDATVAAQSVKTMQDMIGLVEAGSAGAIGRLKGVLAPYAEALGYNSKSLSDAQTYQLLAKTISGSMRMAIVGPGQVSNYETQLLQSISGGGTTATAASKALLQHYADQARAKVDAYNRDRDQLAEVSPQGSKMFPRLIIPAGAAPGNQGGRPPLDSFKR